MQINAVASDADGVGKVFSANVVCGFAEKLRACISADVLFAHRELRANAAALTDIRIFCQAILRAGDVGSQT